jgi:DNA polymerase III subunit gamma/tau
LEVFRVPKQALYLKWRPTTFDDMVGQEHITRTLRNSLKTGRIRHAYLFSGPRGTGKTTSARLLAKAINCRDPNPDNRPCNVCAACVAVNEGRYLDLIEIDAASHTGVDDVRDLRDKIAFSPGEGQYKVYIIDEVHRFSGSAFDALLKTLEEPPDHAIFILATTEIDKVPPTIKSRCLPFEFRLFTLYEVVDRLGKIAESEGLQIEQGALEMVARNGRGSMRDSVSLLDQIVSDPDELITLELVQRILGTASIGAVKDLVAAIINQDSGGGLHVINQALDAGSDPRQFAEQIVEHLRAVLLTQTASADLVEASQEDKSLYQEEADAIERGQLLKAIRAFNEAVSQGRSGWQPQLGLEMALMEALKVEEFIAAPQYTMPQGAIPNQVAAPAQPAPPIEATPPGTPPVIPLQTIQDKWVDMLRMLGRMNKTGPDLVQYFRPLKVDGNLVFLGTDNDLYFERLNVPSKLELVEKSLTAVHKIPLKVKVIIARGGNGGGGSGSDEPTPTPINFDDPLLALGRELGAEIQEQANDEQES